MWYGSAHLPDLGSRKLKKNMHWSYVDFDTENDHDSAFDRLFHVLNVPRSASKSQQKQRLLSINARKVFGSNLRFTIQAITQEPLDTDSQFHMAHSKHLEHLVAFYTSQQKEGKDAAGTAARFETLDLGSILAIVTKLGSSDLARMRVGHSTSTVLLYTRSTLYCSIQFTPYKRVGVIHRSLVTNCPAGRL